MATVKIQHRRGSYTDFDPSQLDSAEIAVTLSNDPNASDGKAIYVGIGSGNVKQLATKEDMESAVETAVNGAISEVTDKVDEYIEEIETTGEEVLDSIPADYTQLSNDVDDLKSDLEQAPGLTNAAREALLACFEHVAWIDEHGQDYYDALYDELYPRRLVRIEATFTQGSTVIYENTPLDDLKANLVVTGYYKDGTSGNITEYSLTGTLTVGTSTVTVTAEGKTDDFSVVVSQDPSIIYQLKNRTFDGTDYVDTDLTPFTEDSDWSIAANLTNTIVSSSAVVRIFGAINSVSPYAGVFLQRDSASGSLIKFQYMTAPETSYDNPQFLSVYDLKMVMTHVQGSGQAKLIYKFNNGDIVQKTLSSTYQTVTAKLMIGHAGGDLWEGTMHEFTLYNKVLTDDAISAFMQGA